MHGDQRPGHPGQRVGRRGAVAGGDREPRAQVHRLRPDQRDDLQPAHQVVLERRPRHGPVQRGGAGSAAPGRDAGPEPQQQRVGVATAAVQLHPQVEPPGAHGRAELLDDLGRVVRRAVRPGLTAHPGHPRGGQHLVHRRRAPGQQRRDRRRRDERDRRVRVGGAQCGEGRLGHDVVAEAVRPQHHDPAHRGHEERRGRESVRHPAPLPPGRTGMRDGGEITPG